eukprot:63296-Pyramimonas_sp.AAC.1
MRLQLFQAIVKRMYAHSAHITAAFGTFDFESRRHGRRGDRHVGSHGGRHGGRYGGQDGGDQGEEGRLALN